MSIGEPIQNMIIEMKPDLVNVPGIPREVASTPRPLRRITNAGRPPRGALTFVQQISRQRRDKGDAIEEATDAAIQGSDSDD
jgi:hypothetical protein